MEIPHIGIDPGHGGDSIGAKHNGIIEKLYTLDLARYARLRIAHSSEPIEVSLIRSSDYTMALSKRGEVSKDLKCGLVISLHVNAHTDRRFHGSMAFFEPSDPHGSAVANQILSAMPYPLQRGSPAIETDVVRRGQWIQRPKNVLAPHRPHASAVLLEVGFCSNERDARLLETPAIQSGIVTAIQSGIDLWRHIIG